MVHRSLSVLVAVAAAMLLSTAALAAPNGRALGHAKNGKNAAVTEDGDRDGVANTPDPRGDADNRHPSGKDKHAEAGGSGNQGSSASEPDGNGRGPERDEGGLDKPDGPGGIDELDQDGNNGCGNDDDFEDDNEGLCLGLGRVGQRLHEAQLATARGGGAGVAEVESVDARAEEPAVPAEEEEAVLAGTVGADRSTPTRAPAAGAPVVAGVLAFTGVDALALIAAALLLALAGSLLLFVGRRDAAIG